MSSFERHRAGDACDHVCDHGNCAATAPRIDSRLTAVDGGSDGSYPITDQIESETVCASAATSRSLDSHDPVSGELRRNFSL